MSKISTQAGLKMILQCLPESPFKEAAKIILSEAVEKLDQLDHFVDANKMVCICRASGQETQGYAGWNNLSEQEKDHVLRMST